MHISEFKLNPKVLEDRIRAVLKSEYPYYFDLKVNLSTVEMLNTMSGPHFMEGDAVGVAVKSVKFSIDVDLEIRTDFEYEHIMTEPKEVKG
jgi:hypothetical protein